MSAANGTGRGFLSRRVLDGLIVGQIVVNIVVLSLVVAVVFSAAGRIAKINQRQIDSVARQNEIQLCVQHDMTLAITKIGEKLGLSVRDISVPDVRGFDCP